MEILVSLERSQLFKQIFDTFVHIGIKFFSSDSRISLFEDFTALELRCATGAKLALAVDRASVISGLVVGVEARLKIALRILIILRRVFHLLDFTLPRILLLLIQLIKQVRRPIHRRIIRILIRLEVLLMRLDFLLFLHLTLLLLDPFSHILIVIELVLRTADSSHYLL